MVNYIKEHSVTSVPSLQLLFDGSAHVFVQWPV